MAVIKKQVLKYDLVSANHHHELVNYVNQGIEQGWELHGFTFETTQSNVLFFHQAMVLRGPLKKTTATKAKKRS